MVGESVRWCPQMYELGQQSLDKRNEAPIALMGRYVRPFDQKKRLTIPSVWRDALGPDSVYVLPDPKNRSLHHSQDHSWAVVCIAGKPEYVKFIPLNYDTAKDVLRFLKQFEYSNKVIDSPIAFKYMVKDYLFNREH